MTLILMCCWFGDACDDEVITPNEAPVMNDISDLEKSETEEFSFTVTAEDSDDLTFEGKTACTSGWFLCWLFFGTHPCINERIEKKKACNTFFWHIAYIDAHYL